MTKLTTKADFYKQPKEIQLAYVYGWAVGVLESIEDLDNEANCQIVSVNPHKTDEEYFSIRFEWCAGIKPSSTRIEFHGHHNIDESEDIIDGDVYWTNFDIMKNQMSTFVKVLQHNAVFNEHYNGINDPDGDREIED